VRRLRRWLLGDAREKPGATAATAAVTRAEALPIEAFTQLAFALARAQDLDGVLWAVAHEAIARLELEDCVVYVVDHTRKLCVQRAAYGPKNPSGYDILNPIVIPIGKGLVGSVARTGKPERVDDVSRDPRYIVDDMARSSELTVPVMHEGRVIGVIDSEHSQTGFFSARHQHVFEAIATLAATRVAQAVLQQELEVARRAAESANRSKTAFLSMMNHELRTPMNGILGVSQLLRESVEKPEQQALVGLIETSAGRLMSVLEDVFTVSDLGLQRLELENARYRPAELIETVRGLFAGAARIQGLSLMLEISEGVPAEQSGDRPRLQQVLVSLLSNAIKFTREGGVRLAVLVDRGELVYRVEDTGCGIEEAQIERLFDVFETADGSSMRGGTGLGLPLARGLSQLMAGDLAVHSVPGKGSRFELRLPLQT
jgi:signal transduction histidine kinase